MLLAVLAVPAASAETLLWSDNFNVADTKNFDTAPLTGRLGGTRADTVFMRSAWTQQTIAGNKLETITASATTTGRVQFQNTEGWYNWAGGTASTGILAANGLRIVFDWMRADDSDYWLSFIIWHSGPVADEPQFRITHPETDYGILFRGSGGTQRFRNGVGTTTGSFSANASTKHVAMDFGFTSFADGQTVTARVEVDGLEVDSHTFVWSGNGGELYMELWAYATGMLIDNFKISTAPSRSEANLLTFGPLGMPAIIDQTAKTISWTLPYGTNLATGLAPTYTTSSGATCLPLVGTTQDFTGPVHYVVTSADNTVTNDYTVTVTVAPEQPGAGLPFSDMTSWWPADGGASDLVGRNHGQVEGGVTFALGKVGRAFMFNGIDGVVRLPDNCFTYPSNTLFTFELWFCTTGSGVLLSGANPAVTSYVPALYVGTD